MKRIWPAFGVFLAVCLGAGLAQEGASAKLESWLMPQKWVRDNDGPVVSLGAAGEFDDMHMFGPAVVRENGEYRLWYGGSRGKVAERILRLGLTKSTDGVHFQKHAGNPVFEFGDQRHSVMTPTVLKQLDGTPIREGGKLRMWFSSTDFMDKSGRHTLHETTSEDGIHWSAPSVEQLANVYAPTVLKDTAGRYRMWYTDVSAEPWLFKHATSADGRTWEVTSQPVLVIDQPWEKGRLFYPCVVQVDGVFLMWYGSYWRDQPQKTAIGFAVSTDGIRWRKHPENPVLRPDPAREWESHYTTSHSVIRLQDGTWRIWYASRTAPPFVHKYFAIGTAKWVGK